MQGPDEIAQLFLTHSDTGNRQSIQCPPSAEQALREGAQLAVGPMRGEPPGAGVEAERTRFQSTARIPYERISKAVQMLYSLVAVFCII